MTDLVCGLMGFLSSTGRAGDRVEQIAAGMHCARHRGPDEAGTWDDGDVAFGFNRLSIIDIAHSHQPLRWGPDGAPDRYALVFNGEIYNYLELREQLRTEFGAEFGTEGDGEAIVAAVHYWGKSAVSRLRGMFAFLIWDTQDRTLFGARDPFGIKPMFTASVAGRHCVLLRRKGSARVDRPGGRRRGRAPALSRPAVRAGAGHHGRRYPPRRVGHPLHPATGVSW